MELCKGEKVALTGLQKGTQYNGKNGTIIGEFKGGRWPVRLAFSDKVLNVRPVNLRYRDSNPDEMDSAGEVCYRLRRALEDTVGPVSGLGYSDVAMSSDAMLGMGSFSVVRKARIKRSSQAPLAGCEVAIKVIARRRIDRGRDALRNTLCLQRERRCLFALGKLKHPFINRLYAAFSDQHNYYLVLGLCTGGELTDVVKAADNGRLPLDQARYYFACVVDAVAAMHAAGVAHRDVKPDNVILTAQGRPQIIDFGCACGLEKTERDAKGDTDFVGTPQYMAPEAMDTERVDERRAVDLWAMGCFLYFTLTGKHLFNAASEYLTLKCVQEAKYSLPEDYPEDAKAITTALLVRDPSKRLGFKDTGSIREHRFFRSIDWTGLYSMKPPPSRDSMERASAAIKSGPKATPPGGRGTTKE